MPAKSKKQHPPDREQINARLTAEAVKKIDRLLAHYQGQTDLRVTRSDVIRRAVDSLAEKEFGNNSENP
jgi:Arc/MetJ-type ribon-helix-helix transcriptional regulator